MRGPVALLAIALVASIGLFFAWAVGSAGFIVLFGVILGLGITFGALELRTRWQPIAKPLTNDGHTPGAPEQAG